MLVFLSAFCMQSVCVRICIHVIIVSVVVTLSGIWPCVWRWALNKSSLSRFFLLFHACSLSHCGTSWGAAGTTQPPFRCSWPRRCWRRFRTSSCPTCSATTSNPNPRSSAKAPSLQSTPSPSQSSEVFCGYHSLPLLRAVMCSVSTIHPPPPPSPSSGVFCVHHTPPPPHPPALTKQWCVLYPPFRPPSISKSSDVCACASLFFIPEQSHFWI